MRVMISASLDDPHLDDLQLAEQAVSLADALLREATAERDSG